MTTITVKLTPKELELLTTLASDQLFHREFIDSRMPGFRAQPAELHSAKALVTRLRTILDPAAARKKPAGITHAE